MASRFDSLGVSEHAGISNSRMSSIRHGYNSAVHPSASSRVASSSDGTAVGAVLLESPQL